jgi:signal transduction histidine kinase
MICLIFFWGGKTLENPLPTPLNAELFLVCSISPTFNINKKLGDSLKRTLQTFVRSFEFWRAGLFLLREGRPPVHWQAIKNLRPAVGDTGNFPETDRWPQLCAEVAQKGENGEDKYLERFHPVISTTLPIFLKAGDPVGTMEIGIFDTDLQSAQYMLSKAVSLGRHMADMIQESLFQKQRGRLLRKLALWLEMVNTISSTLDIRQVLHIVAQLTADLFSAKSCIYLLDEKDQTLIPAVAVGSFDPVLKKKFKALRGTQPFPAIKRVIKTKQPVHVTPHNIRRLLTGEIIEDFDYCWMVLAPILHKDKIIGIMQVDRPLEANAFNREDTEIIFAISRATAIAIENARLIEMLEQKEDLLHQLVNKLITAQEDERKRLASDLHDGIIQSLIAIWYRLQRITPSGEGTPQEWFGEIFDLTDLLSEQIQEIRRILYDLRPIILDNYGLIPAMESYINTFQEQNNLAAKLFIRGQETKLDSKVEITFFRILQEALTNISKHAQANMVEVTLTFTETRVTLEVNDDGIGMDNSSPGESRHNRKGLGLASVYERALLLGGFCHIHSRPGEGTSVSVSIPLK